MSIYEYDEEKLRQIDIQTGHARGKAEGRVEERTELIQNALQRGKSPEAVSEFLGVPLEEVLEIAKGNK